MSSPSPGRDRLDRLDHYVDLQRYPIHALDSDAGHQMIGHAHEMMVRDTVCLMPGFLRAQAVAELSAEINSTASVAHQIDYPSTPYAWMNNTGYPPDHPRSALLRRNCGVLTTDQFAPTGPCRELFQFDQITECIRRMLRFDTLYRSACPTLSIQVNIMREGEGFGWHFDTNDGVVSFMIQNADAGGAFEYAPLIRDEGAENYPAVARLFAEHEQPSRPELPPGTFTLFLGRRSAHRVAPVGVTRQARLSLLYSYDRQPGMCFPEGACQSILNPSPEPFLGVLETEPA